MLNDCFSVHQQPPEPKILQQQALQDVRSEAPWSAWLRTPQRKGGRTFKRSPAGECSTAFVCSQPSKDRAGRRDSYVYCTQLPERPQQRNERNVFRLTNLDSSLDHLLSSDNSTITSSFVSSSHFSVPRSFHTLNQTIRAPPTTPPPGFPS